MPTSVHTQNILPKILCAEVCFKCEQCGMMLCTVARLVDNNVPTKSKWIVLDEVIEFYGAESPEKGEGLLKHISFQYDEQHTF